jgi:thymidylate kinase
LPTSVVVFGSLPPGARDLDLLVRAGEEAVVGSALEEAGLVGRGSKFAAFGACTAFGVELTAVTSWGLPRREAEALFADSIPLEGAERIRRPAPAHALLILARRLALSRGHLADKLRPRIARVLAEDPAAWANARERAAAWGLDDALTALEEVHRCADVSVAAPGAVRTRARRRLAAVPRPRRPLVIALSGLDGAGKSSHAAALRDALGRLDVPAAVVWTPLGQNTTLELIGRPAKKLLSLLRFGPLRPLAEQSATGSVFSNPGRRPNGRGAGAVMVAAWATFVAILNVLSQRRALARHALGARVVIYDRHALDSIVRMRFLYGASGRFGLRERLVRVGAPRPRLEYYLQVRPETAYSRKPDWTLEQLRVQAELYDVLVESFATRTLDAERPPEDVCAEIASAVWRELA